MGYELQQFAAECRQALNHDSGPAGIEQARQCVEKAVSDDVFVERHLGSENKSPRKILYEDPELGFCILAHVYLGAKTSPPHDHGPSWAIYGQAKGTTEMTDWELVNPPNGDQPGKVKQLRTYELRPGMARAYNIGDLHNPKRTEETRLIRIEGMNMEKVQRDKFQPV